MKKKQNQAQGLTLRQITKEYGIPKPMIKKYFPRGELRSVRARQVYGTFLRFGGADQHGVQDFVHMVGGDKVQRRRHIRVNHAAAFRHAAHSADLAADGEFHRDFLHHSIGRHNGVGCFGMALRRKSRRAFLRDMKNSTQTEVELDTFTLP